VGVSQARPPIVENIKKEWCGSVWFIETTRLPPEESLFPV